MNLKENEKKYYDKIVVLYNKYGENIPDADLMHLSVVEKELGISFKRSQELFELVKNHAKSEKVEITASFANDKPEEVKVAADIENNTNVSEPKKAIETPQINRIPIKNKSKIEKKKLFLRTATEDKSTKEAVTAHDKSFVEDSMHKNIKIPTKENIAAHVEPTVNVPEQNKMGKTAKETITAHDEPFVEDSMHKNIEMSTKETTTSYVDPLINDSEQQNMGKSTQPVNIKECTLDGGNMDLIPVEDPGDINKWKVIFFYTIGFLTIILWGIGLIIIIWETVAIIRHKNKQLKYAKYLVQRDQRKQ